MIEANNISKSYGSLAVLQDVSLNVAKGEIVAIVGASGAGKTTLLQIIGTLDKADSGSVVINGRNTAAMNDKALSLFRNKEIGFVYQFHHLLSEFTALENIIIPALIGGTKRKDAQDRAMFLLDKLNVGNRASHKPNELSGGEQQRIAVARALINSPSVLLADEPSGNLDTHNATELHNLFLSLRDDFGQTIVIVTHNFQLAKMSDRTVTIKDGRIIS
ncbi:MAG: ABC transporter ATP-binding protein [Bacteroidales bacterium]|jgi:lipoprotein-releasing system ATP-binding protein|nr:ABC transporter ATP-binding protein [Bacteroidales bacterium]